MGRVEGKVAFITGAGRGQGRSHAVRLAEEGADIIAVDICHDLPTVSYPLATPEDLAETVALVEARDRRIVAAQADVRDRAALAAALARGLAELGRVDIVVAQAGILPMRGEPMMHAWIDGVDILLLGTINAIHVALPHLAAGASIIATSSSVTGMSSNHMAEAGVDPGSTAYQYSKLAMARYGHELARALGPQEIRVNVLHPTSVDTPMIHNEATYRAFRPDLENPTRADAERVLPTMHLMPEPCIAPEDVSEAVVYLASDESRYVTGLQFRVDAGSYLRFQEFHI